jgi:hypothetical protein
MRRHEKLRKAALSNLTPAQEKLKAAGYAACQFNQYVSDNIPLDRVGRDTRHPQCHDKRYYPSRLMPPVSVIIVFYNEAGDSIFLYLSTFLNTCPTCSRIY